MRHLMDQGRKRSDTTNQRMYTEKKFKLIRTDTTLDLGKNPKQMYTELLIKPKRTDTTFDLSQKPGCECDLQGSG